MASVPVESSFAQILNRTQQNLNRINQRYAPPTGQSISLLSNNIANDRFQILAPSEPVRDRLAGRDVTNKPKPAAVTTVAINEDILRDMLERITTLESRRSEEANILTRLDRVEKLLTSSEKNIDNINYEVKDLQRQASHLQSRISNSETLYEASKVEHESRRGMNAKIDHWIRDHDSWRDEIERVTSQLRKELSDFKHDKSDIRDRIQSFATRSDVDQIKDKVHLIAQQSVSTTIAAWSETTETKLRNLERDLALLKVGQSQAVQREIAGAVDEHVTRRQELSAEVIAKALDAPTPSETLVKGMVAAEILRLQTTMEQKVDKQIESDLSQGIAEAKRALASQFEQQIMAIGLMESVGHTSFSLNTSDNVLNTASSTSGANAGADADVVRLRREFDRRVMAGKSKLDMLEKSLQDRLTNVTESLYNLQSRYETSDKAHVACERLLTERVEAVVHQNESLLQTTLTRAQHHETLLTASEQKLQALIEMRYQDSLQRTQDQQNDLADTRLLLERRLLPLEQSARDWLHELRVQQERFTTLLQTHPIIQEATKLAKTVETVHQEQRETAATVLKLQAQSCTLNDHLTLKEVVSRMDTIVHQRCPEYFHMTKQLLEASQQVTARIQQVEHHTNTLLGESEQQRRRLEAQETTSLQTLSRSNVLHEDLQLTKSRVDGQEKTLQKDLSALKDLTGSLSSRIQSVEGKASVQTRAQAAEANAFTQQLRLLDEKVLQVDAALQRLLINMTFQQQQQQAVQPPAPPVERVITPRKPAPAATTAPVTMSTPAAAQAEDAVADADATSPFVASPLSDAGYERVLVASQTVASPPSTAVKSTPATTKAALATSTSVLSPLSTVEKQTPQPHHQHNTPSAVQASGGVADFSTTSWDSPSPMKPQQQTMLVDLIYDKHHQQQPEQAQQQPRQTKGFDSSDDEEEDDDEVDVSPTKKSPERSHRLGAEDDDEEDDQDEEDRKGHENDDSFQSDNDQGDEKAEDESSRDSDRDSASFGDDKESSGRSRSSSDASSKELSDVDEVINSFMDEDEAVEQDRQQARLQSAQGAAAIDSTKTAASATAPQQPPSLQQQVSYGQQSFSRDDASDWDASMSLDGNESFASGGPRSNVKAQVHSPMSAATSNKPTVSGLSSSAATAAALISSSSHRNADNNNNYGNRAGQQPLHTSDDDSSVGAMPNTLDISDSSHSQHSDESLHRRPQQPQSRQTVTASSNTATAASALDGKKKPSILDGLSDEDSSDLSIDYRQKTEQQQKQPQEKGIATSATSSASARTAVSAPAIASSAVPTASTAGSSTAATRPKPSILDGLSDEDSSDDDVPKKKATTTISTPAPATNTTAPKVTTTSSPATASIPVAATPAPSSAVPAVTTSAPTPTTSTVPPINTAGLSARERLRLRQEAMKAQRSTTNSTAVSAAPSGANSPVQAPSSPVNLPKVSQTPSTTSIKPNPLFSSSTPSDSAAAGATIAQGVKRGVKDDSTSSQSGVMSFVAEEDDEFDNSFDD